MKLTRWDTEETLHATKHVTIKRCVEDAIKQGVSLYRINLTGVALKGANLRDADLTGADLTGANLAKADLKGANLRDTDLTGADLRDAFLRNADLTGADLDYSSWPIWCGSCEVKLDKENNERFAYHAMINMDEDVLAEFLKNPVEFANRFAERKDIDKIKAGEK